MINRRMFLCGLTLGTLAAPLNSEAQQAGNVPRIGVLVPVEPASPTEPNVAAFRQGLRSLGYVEGQNIMVEYRWADGIFRQLPALAADLVRLNVRLIVAASNREITAAKEATTTIPIVMVNAIDPIGAGYIASLSRPGRNLTGLAWAPAVEIVGKHMEFLREAMPHLSRIAVIVDPGFPGIGPYRDAAEGPPGNFI